MTPKKKTDIKDIEEQPAPLKFVAVDVFEVVGLVTEDGKVQCIGTFNPTAKQVAAALAEGTKIIAAQNARNDANGEKQ